MTGAAILTALSFLFAAGCFFLARYSSRKSEESDRRTEDLRAYVDSHLLGLEQDVKRLQREMVENEYSHGVLAMEIKEISSLKKTDELRKEVLKTKEDDA